VSWSYEQTLTAKWQQNQVERQRALAEVEAAHTDEDWQSLEIATARLRSADNEARWLREKANALIQQQQHAQARPSNQYGLRHDEEEAALAAIPDRPDIRLTREQKLQSYAAQKARYLQMRRDGSYSDSQGRRREKF
jgi:hypothetical protein